LSTFNKVYDDDDDDDQGNRVPLPTPVHGSSTGECGLLAKYYDHRMKCRCSHLRCLASIFPPAALCLCNDNNNNNIRFLKIDKPQLNTEMLKVKSP